LRRADMEGADETGGMGAAVSLRMCVLWRRKSLQVMRLACSGWFSEAAMSRSDATAAAEALAEPELGIELGAAAAAGKARPASAGCRGGRPSAAADARLGAEDATPPPSRRM
jgi:hypothetical protein